MFAGIYYGGMYGGSTTSILLNTPGESASVVTAIEGNKMARRAGGPPGSRHRCHRVVHRRHDRHAAARPAAPQSSSSSPSASGAPDYFAIMVLAFIAVTTVLGSSKSAGSPRWGSACSSASSGIDSVTGQQRLTLGMPQLADGIDVVVVAVGLFAVGEALWVAAHLRRTPLRSSRSGRPG